jgi:hypothetical protein
MAKLRMERRTFVHLYITIERQYPSKETRPKEPHSIHENPGLNPISKTNQSNP